MKIVPILSLALILAAASPLPTESGRIIIHAETVNGPMDLFVPADGWVYIRPYQMPWLGPFTDAQLDAFGGYEAATVGTTFCTSTLVHVGLVTTLIQVEVEIEEDAPTLEGAVSKAKEKIKLALPPGTMVTPCPVASPL